MLSALLIAALAVLPRLSEPVADSCAVIELNTTYDFDGRELFKQNIYWLWNERLGRLECRGFNIIKHESQIPRPDCCGRKHYTTLWRDGEVNRLVVADSFKETWTQHDPELVEREYLPKELRRELRVIRVDKPSGAIRPARRAVR
jgi:hypothetical protein